MTLTCEQLRIDCPRVEKIICNFIQEQMTRLNREGIVVPISGGLDSTTMLMLCVRAVGAEQVTGLLLPEKQGNPEAEYFAARAAEHMRNPSKAPAAI